jgi:hypothetical protein
LHMLDNFLFIILVVVGVEVTVWFKTTVWCKVRLFYYMLRNFPTR